MGHRMQDYGVSISGSLFLIGQPDGPIYSLKLGSQTLVVLNTDTAIRDLLEKRSQIYSGRMDFFLRYHGDDLNILFRT
jgi:hypothetical protein